MSLSDRIRTAFNRNASLSQAGLARACGISRASVNAWASGKTESIDGKFLTTAAAYLGVEAHWLSTGEGKMVAGTSPAMEKSNVTDGPPVKGVYPLISKVQAGMWTALCNQFQPGHADEWLPSTKNLGRCGYMLRVEGRSMENASGRPNFAEGMVLHVNPDLVPEPGQYVVVRRSGTEEATFKRYVLIDGAKYLEAINPDWPKDMKYLPLQPGDEWCGVVVDASLGGLL